MTTDQEKQLRMYYDGQNTELFLGNDIQVMDKTEKLWEDQDCDWEEGEEGEEGEEDWDAIGGSDLEEGKGEGLLGGEKKGGMDGLGGLGGWGVEEGEGEDDDFDSEMDEFVDESMKEMGKWRGKGGMDMKGLEEDMKEDMGDRRTQAPEEVVSDGEIEFEDGEDDLGGFLEKK